MADEKRGAKRKRSKPLRYFFLNGDLHKSMHINRSKDIIWAWNYPKAKRAAYTYSDVKKRAGKAFTTKQVCEMVGRTRLILERAIISGNINAPQMTYGLDENRRPHKYMWSEKDIMDLHAFMMTVHRGRPRRDGLITSSNLPTARELRAMIHQETVLYVKNDDGEFVPTWKATNF